MPAGRSAPRCRLTAWRRLPDNVAFRGCRGLAGRRADGAADLAPRRAAARQAGADHRRRRRRRASRRPRSRRAPAPMSPPSSAARSAAGICAAPTRSSRASTRRRGRFALILEAAGGASLAAAIARVEAKGTIVVFGNSSGEPTQLSFRDFAEHPNARIQGFSYFTSEAEERFAPDLALLVSLIAEGSLKPHLVERELAGDRPDRPAAARPADPRQSGISHRMNGGAKP